MTDAILVLNAGSSSLKFAGYPDGDGTSVTILRGKIAGIGTSPVYMLKDGSAVPNADFPQIERAKGMDDLIPSLLGWLNAHLDGITIRAAGHRVVHGGRHRYEPARVTAALLADLEALVPLAPMHQPHNLAAIRYVAASEPNLPQVACFDTSFHRTQGRLSQLFALPRALSEGGSSDMVSMDYPMITSPAFYPSTLAVRQMGASSLRI